MRSFGSSSAVGAALFALTLWMSAPAVADGGAAPDRNVLPLRDAPFHGKIGLRPSDSERDFPPEVTAPKGAPNVLIILTDDVGFGATSTFGGPIPTPTFDRIANGGLRYNRFHTTALCSPTRAALLTGRNHHSVGTACIMEAGIGYPGYNTLIPKSKRGLGDILKLNGYNTAWFGKNHNVPDWHSSQAGPFDLWPTGLGFEYFFGFIGGDTNQWAPAIVENTRPIEPPHDDPDYNFDRDMADRCVKWLRMQHAVAPDKPFFAYYAPGTAHAPHHAPRDWIAKFKGQFDHGWDKQRELTLAKQKQIGVVPSNTELTARSKGIADWDSLNADEKRLYAKARGEIRSQFHHVIDILPTILEAADVPEPMSVYGVEQAPVEGVSMVYSFDNAKAPSTRATQYFEMFANRAIYNDGWVATTTPTTPPWVAVAEAIDPIDGYQWELYNVEEDFSQAKNVAAAHPEKLRELQRLFYIEAVKHDVLPLDNSKVERLDVQNRPSLTRGRKEFVYYDDMTRIPEGSAPDLKNKSFGISAVVNVPDDGTEGMIMTQGGRFCGVGLYMLKGRPVFHYNVCGVDRHTVQAPDPLGPGRHVVTVDFNYDGGGVGKGGTLTLTVDGKTVGSKQVPRTVAFRMSLDETLDIGVDTGTPVAEDYAVPFRFTGEVEKVTISLADHKLTEGELQKYREGRLKGAVSQ